MKRTFFILSAWFVALAAVATCKPFAIGEAMTSTPTNFGTVNISGPKTWVFNSYGAVANGYGSTEYEEDWLVSRSLDLSQHETATLEFEHAAEYGVKADFPEQLSLQISTNYTGDIAAATWTQIAIPNMPLADKTYAFVKNRIKIPAEFRTANTTIAFKYSAPSSYPLWEIKNLTITATCANLGDIDVPKPLPLEVPNVHGNVKILGQNLENYCFSYTDPKLSERTSCKNATCFAKKTHQIVDVFRFVDADIYAMNEMEATNEAVAQLVDSLNVGLKNPNFAYVVDNATLHPEFDGNELIKSAFIYRKDRVKPVGSNIPGYNVYYYRNQMRIQAFEHLATGEQFAVSMNHFKAKNGASDNGETNEMRVKNANAVLSTLRNRIEKTYPKILLMGDLNCPVGEEPIDILQAAGFSEQIVRFDPNAYSHCWDGGELIDHLMVNEALLPHVTGAAVYHISTACGESSKYNSAYRYSDHDPYLIGLCFDCDDVAISSVSAPSATVFTVDHTIFVEADNVANITIYNIMGQRLAHASNVITAQFAAPQGIYIVKISNETQKVVVK